MKTLRHSVALFDKDGDPCFAFDNGRWYREPRLANVSELVVRSHILQALREASRQVGPRDVDVALAAYQQAAADPTLKDFLAALRGDVTNNPIAAAIRRLVS